MGTALPCLLLQGWLNHTSTHRVIYIVLLRVGAVSALSSAAPGLGCTGNLPAPLISGPALPPNPAIEVWGGEGERASFPSQCYHKTDEK